MAGKPTTRDVARDTKKKKAETEELLSILQNPIKGKEPGCGIYLYEKANPTTGAAIVDAVANLRWSANALAEVFAVRDVPVTRNMIDRHRRGQCSCFRKADND